MRILFLLAACALAGVAASAAAQDRPYDPKALARYDASYASCEATFRYMAGHKDEAYLSLWQVELGPKTAAHLAEARSAAAYKAERQNIVHTGAKPAALAASSVMGRQCRALWGEYNRLPRTKKP